MKQSIWVALKEIIGGTPREVLVKIFLGFITLAVAAIRDSSFFIMGFLLGILVDAILGTWIAVREGGWSSVKFQRWITGPLTKGIVITMFLVIAAILDMFMNKTPIQYMGSSPIVITGSVIGFVTILMDIGSKGQKLTGYKITDWFASAFERIRPKKEGGQ